MKFRVAAATSLMLGVSVMGATAQEWTISIMGGKTEYPKLSYDGGKVPVRNGTNGGVRFGYKLDDWMPISGFSIQGDIFYATSQLRGQTNAPFNSFSGMGDLIYRPDLGIPFGVYGGAGSGAVRTEIRDPLSTRGSTVFGWQALGGVDMDISPNARLFVEYRYQNAHNANLRFVGGSVGNTSDSVSVGVAFGF